jgi:hypothetical protein
MVEVRAGTAWRKTAKKGKATRRWPALARPRQCGLEGEREQVATVLPRYALTAGLNPGAASKKAVVKWTTKEAVELKSRGEHRERRSPGHGEGGEGGEWLSVTLTVPERLALMFAFQQHSPLERDLLGDGNRRILGDGNRRIRR